MSNLLWSIVRAAHCRSTHDYLAVDALPLAQTGPARRLVGHLLTNYRRYLAGANDPDVRFRDFQNHIVQVQDDYWGGAPRVAHQWHERLLRYLRTDRFSDAAHAAGVLSHYFTDPFQPLHTQYSEREAVIHRPFEWCINQSYDSILQSWKADQMRIVFSLSNRSHWLGEAIMHGAKFANIKFHRIMKRFDLATAVKDPSRGLDGDLRASMAEILGMTITGWARVLERTALDAESVRRSPLPEVDDSLAIASAIGRAPIAWWKCRRANRHEQREVEELYDEWLRLGYLNQHLPVEVDIVGRVMRIYHQERKGKRSRLARVEPANKLPLSEQTMPCRTGQTAEDKPGAKATPDRSGKSKGPIETMDRSRSTRRAA